MLLTYIENSRLIREEQSGKFDLECDILVAGLGTAGAFAAICAAREGCRVIGVEKSSAMGGMGTLACVWDYYYGSFGGEYESIDSYCREITERENYLPVGDPEICINGAVKQQVLESEAKKNGCRLIYEASICGVFIDGGDRVCGVRIFCDGKFTDIAAKVVIDSTGNAAVCRFAGCEFGRGRLFDNIYMKASKPVIALRGGNARGEWGMCGRIDGVSPEGISGAISKGLSVGNLSRSHFEGNGRVMFDGALLGVRESPNVITDRVYTLDDYRQGVEQTDILMYACGPLDNTNHDVAFEDAESQNYRILCNLTDYGFSLGVSREMMLPRGMDGIIVACRAIGVDHNLAGMLRMKKDMQKLGEAAAVLASESVKRGLPLRDTELSPVIKRLSETGCYNKENDKGLCFLQKQYIFTPRVLPCDAGGLMSSFASDEPGIGVWSYISGHAKVGQDELEEMLTSDIKSIRFGTALSLGITGDRKALPVLREMLCDCSPLSNIPDKVSSPWASFYPSDIQAMILLGRFADTESSEALLDTVRDGGKKRAEFFSKSNLRHSGAKPIQYFEYAAKAVLDISNAHGDISLKDELRHIISSSEVLKSDEYAESVGTLGKILFD